MAWITATLPYQDMLKLQRLMMRDAENENTSPADRAKIALAYDRLEDRKRILRGRPLPGSERPGERKPRRRAHGARVMPACADGTGGGDNVDDNTATNSAPDDDVTGATAAGA